RVAGSEFNEERSGGVHYTRAEKGARPEYVFAFTATDGTVYRNRVSLLPANFAAETPAELSRSRSVWLRYEGPPVEKGEKVVLQFTQEGASESFEAEEGGTEVAISRARLGKVKDGPVTIRWVRPRSGAVQEGTPRGGWVEVEYITESREVRLVP